MFRITLIIFVLMMVTCKNSDEKGIEMPYWLFNSYSDTTLNYHFNNEYDKPVILFSNKKSNGKTPVFIHLYISKDNYVSEDISIFLNTADDVIERFKVKDLNLESDDMFYARINENGFYNLIFEYQHKNIIDSVSHEFELFGDEKFVMIRLWFGKNDTGTEYLKELKVIRYYTANALIMETAWNMEPGEKPLFHIINKGNKTYYGPNITGQFFGKMFRKIDNRWVFMTAGSYCVNSGSEGPFKKGDTVEAFVPSYFVSNEFKLEYSGVYKFVVALGTERFEYGLPQKITDSAHTKKSTINLYEIEKEFEIK